MMHTSLNCTRCQLCASAETIFSPGSTVHWVLLFQLFLTPLSLLSVVLMSLAVFFTKQVHSNMKVLLLSFLSATLVANIGVLLSCVYQLYAGFVITKEDRCEWQIFKGDSSLGMKNVYVIGVLGMVTSPITLAVERSYAAVNYKSYHITSNRLIPLALVLIHILLSISVLFVDITSPKQVFPYAALELYSGKINFIGVVALAGLIHATELIKKDFLTHSFQISFKAIEAAKVLFGTNLFSCFVFVLLSVLNGSRLMHLELLSNEDATRLRRIFVSTNELFPLIILNLLFVVSASVVFHNMLPVYDHNTLIDVHVLRNVEQYAPWAEYQIALIPVETLIIVSLTIMISPNLRSSLLRVSGFDRWLVAKQPTPIVATPELRQRYMAEKTL